MRHENLVVTIGNFDGVHLGHQALMTKTIERAKIIGGASLAMTFEPHPMRVLRPSVNLPMITPLERKLELLQAQGVDLVLCLRFDPDFAALSADAFVEKLLVARLRAAELVVGHDFNFGHKGLGDVALLQAKGQDLGFKVHQVGPIMVDGRPASSTRVRQAIGDGDMAATRHLLGRHYRVAGSVERGFGRGGRLLGFPTANLNPGQHMLPGIGVYAVLAQPEGREPLPAVTNIGVNPTFSDASLSMETHILDWDADIYGQQLSVHFVERLRGEKRFNSLEELSAAITADVALARGILAPWSAGQKSPQTD